MPLASATRATAAELQPHIIRFVGSTGAGQWSFQLLCKFCTDLGTVSAAAHSIGDAKALRKAAESFVEQGWWINGVPICPKCYRRKNI